MPWRLGTDFFEPRIVDLLQAGKVVSVLCAVCGSFGGHVVRRSLLGNCPVALTPEQLALRDAPLGFLLDSKRTARLDKVLGKFLRACPFLSRFRPPPFATAVLRDVLLSLRLNQPQLDLHVSVAVFQPWS